MEANLVTVNCAALQDFRDLIALHNRSEADVTIATHSVSRERAEHLGVARVSQQTGDAPGLRYSRL